MKNETHLLLENLGLRDGSAPKSVHSSPRRPKLSSLPPHRKLTPAPGDTPARIAQPHPQTHLTKKKKNLKMYLFQTKKSKIGIFLRRCVNTLILQTTQRISDNYPQAVLKIASVCKILHGAKDWQTWKRF